MKLMVRANEQVKPSSISTEQQHNAANFWDGYHLKIFPGSPQICTQEEVQKPPNPKIHGLEHKNLPGTVRETPQCQPAEQEPIA
jgi:hypothetical protein